MKIVRFNDALLRKLDLEKRQYYLFNDFELIVTELLPGDQQASHYHKKILEAYYIIAGSIEFYIKSDEMKGFFVLKKGDAIVFYPNEAHSLKNKFGEIAITLTIKKFYDSNDYKNIFKSDKYDL
jgi:quercetin dioxygenase-like cupin family protein